MKAHPETEAFAARLTAKFGREFTALPGRKYDKIVSEHSVHAFVEFDSGKLVKAAGYNAPAKGVNGLLSNYNLGTPEGFEEAVTAADAYGGYLYQR